MKTQIIVIMIGVLLGCLMTTDGWAQKKSPDNFEMLKKLEGEWTGVRSDGKTVETSYKIMSNGSAVVETMIPEGEPSMITVYHLNGDELMLTHYCSAGNQPRMKASMSSGEINFKFVDVTNLKSESTGHMKKLNLVFVDEQHLNQVWTWSEGDQEMSEVFEYERIR